MFTHDDLVGGERDQRAARHGIVRHKDGDPALVLGDRTRNLLTAPSDAREIKHWALVIVSLDILRRGSTGNVEEPRIASGCDFERRVHPRKICSTCLCPVPARYWGPQTSGIGSKR